MVDETPSSVRVCVRLHPGSDPELVAAEAWEAGIAGVEEREEAGFTELVLYAEASRAGALRERLSGLAGVARCGVPEPLAPVDWREQWKQGIGAVEVSPRLRIRPSFVESPTVSDGEGVPEVVLDPGLAFGTGHHASTRLALEWIDVCCRERPPVSVLDVGTGSGVLALAALRLGAQRAVGFDVDRLAAPEARRWARLNRLEEGLLVFSGPLAALADAQFDLVVANLIRSELLPLARELVARLAPHGQLVLSGLLARDWPSVEQRFEALGLAGVGLRACRDDTGDRWLAPLMQRRAPSPPPRSP